MKHDKRIRMIYMELTVIAFLEYGNCDNKHRNS